MLWAWASSIAGGQLAPGAGQLGELRTEVGVARAIGGLGAASQRQLGGKLGVGVQEQPGHPQRVVGAQRRPATAAPPPAAAAGAAPRRGGSAARTASP